MANAALDSWTSIFEAIKTKHDAAYLAIDHAISLENQKEPQKALYKYREAIVLIDEALRIPMICSKNLDFAWGRADVMKEKMRKTRTEVLTRINRIRNRASYEETLSNNIVTGASYLSKVLVLGAEKVGSFLNQSIPMLMTGMSRADTPTEISPNITRGMQIAENVTSNTAKVTGYIADQICAATMKLGYFLAPHIQEQGTRLLTSSFSMSERQASAKMKGVLTVAAGAVEGFSTVYQGLGTSASILGESLKNNTVKVVQHKYGEPAGDLTRDTLSTFGNVVYVSHNARIFHPKNVVKRAAKDTGKAMMNEYSQFRATSYKTGTKPIVLIKNTK